MPKNWMWHCTYIWFHLKIARSFFDLKSLYTLSKFKLRTKKCIMNPFTVTSCSAVGVSNSITGSWGPQLLAQA